VNASDIMSAPMTAETATPGTALPPAPGEYGGPLLDGQVGEDDLDDDEDDDTDDVNLVGAETQRGVLLCRHNPWHSLHALERTAMVEVSDAAYAHCC
jgi:hypothetical protein